MFGTWSAVHTVCRENCGMWNISFYKKHAHTIMPSSCIRSSYDCILITPWDDDLSTTLFDRNG